MEPVHHGIECHVKCLLPHFHALLHNGNEVRHSPRFALLLPTRCDLPPT